MEFGTGFTVIGEDQETEDDELAPVGPGSVFSIDQDLFEEVGEAWNRPGDPVGEAHGSVVVTRKQFATCNITFTFSSEDVVVVQGLLPVDGKNLGGGVLAVTGGTGQLNKASGRVDVETQNPKRWSFLL
jgi:hypothetical protein